MLTELSGNDLIICAITSQTTQSRYSVKIETDDFESGSLRKTSYAKINRILTVDKQIILYKIGSLKSDKINEVIKKIIQILQ